MQLNRAQTITVPIGLKTGDTIGIVAPAGGFDRLKFDRGVDILKSMGFQVKYPNDLFEFEGYLSGPDHIRASHLHAAFADPEVNSVLCARGGYGSIRILPRLDFDLIRKHPKRFVGFSDISVLLSAFYMKCGFAVFHGPMAATLTDMDDAAIGAMQDALTFTGKYELALENCRMVRAGRARGPVAGGNLTTLCHLMGTAFQPNWQGHILFLEDTGEAPYRIDRMMTHLKLAGCFDGIHGLILGTFDGCGEYSHVEKIAVDLLKSLDIPVVAQFPAGHGRENMTIPMGISALLDTDNARIIYEI